MQIEVVPGCLGIQYLVAQSYQVEERMVVVGVVPVVEGTPSSPGQGSLGLAYGPAAIGELRRMNGMKYCILKMECGCTGTILPLAPVP